MKGYVYLTPDGDLVTKSFEYIQDHDPNFFGNNKAFVVSYWPFDTENDVEMNSLLTSFKQHWQVRSKPSAIYDFFRGISYDTSKLKTKIIDVGDIMKNLGPNGQSSR